MDKDWEKIYWEDKEAQHYDNRYRGFQRRMNNHRIRSVLLRMLRKTGGGTFPRRVVDAPAGTGRFSHELSQLGIDMVHLDLSPKMLGVLRSKHGPGKEVVGNLYQPPLAFDENAVVMSFRLMQHFDNPEERIHALKGFAKIAPSALVAYYPGWHLKFFSRRLRHKLGLPHNKLREFISKKGIKEEVEAAGWELKELRQCFPVFSENVLLHLKQPN
ncbi:MAG: methyltransferase domain-containing protein [Planctomycetota bacterium]|jgi:SAM-dependent methyltransferase|nr:methyltransferase domain-containing protein [Planctomycetota bacterium]MDP6940826.1 methyltransferase domain-containing protein [Planctomycetota bacterium]